MTAPLFAGVVGHGRALQLLCATLAADRLVPAYLFAGPEGVGRSLVARRFIEGLSGAGLNGDLGLRRRLELGNHPDLLWVEPTYSEKSQQKKGLPQLRLEQIREVTRFLARPPLEAPRSVVVLEGAERMAEGAANALLKTLEEPGQGLLILLTAAPEQLLSTILSRCMRISFRPLAPAELAEVVPDQGDPAELLALAAGSPGALLEWRRRWQELPEALLVMPENPMAAMDLARQISDQLDGEQQLWLIGLLQRRLWLSTGQVKQLQRLERLGKHLKGNVQPRLAWEVALLDLCA
ncbi:DNA polymerase III subunit delta' [Synechococcus lacustris C3-12m-Tous]|uniref:DNA polymerase III subunit delta' n=1 Tax=Synechococcus lacustris TaxID=2116544 RepID=UPI0020CD82B8|nr:DNA polymerase III subunit delta' [Synechococcus lacustris]MCP9924955.1 DNA polymerase III subunit delta' [Synechococcus lacustris C3-12m-Tous]